MIFSKPRPIFLWWLFVPFEEHRISFQKLAGNVNINREAN